MMRYDSHPLKDRRVTVPNLPIKVNIALQRAETMARTLLAKRQDHLWLSLVAVPLAMTAVALQFELWLMVPIAVVCWWWASSASQWLWLLGIMEGCFGIIWAYLGAYLLAEFPHNRIAVGAGWAAYALVVAIGGCVNRWRFKHRYGW